FRARAYKAHLLHVRKGGQDDFGEIGLSWSRGTKTRAIARGGNDRVDNLTRGVAQNHGSPGTDVVDVLIAIGVENAGPLTPHDERRLPAHRAECAYRRIYSSGNHLFSALLQLARDLGLAGHGLLQKHHGISAGALRGECRHSEM